MNQDVSFLLACGEEYEAERGRGGAQAFTRDGLHRRTRFSQDEGELVLFVHLVAVFVLLGVRGEEPLFTAITILILFKLLLPDKI